MSHENPTFIPTVLQDAVNWAQKYSLFTYPFATACCAIRNVRVDDLHQAGRIAPVQLLALAQDAVKADGAGHGGLSSE